MWSGSPRTHQLLAGAVGTLYFSRSSCCAPAEAQLSCGCCWLWLLPLCQQWGASQAHGTGKDILNSICCYLSKHTFHKWILAAPARNYHDSITPSALFSSKTTLGLFSLWLHETFQLLFLPRWLRWKTQHVSHALALSRLLVSTSYIMTGDSHKGLRSMTAFSSAALLLPITLTRSWRRREDPCLPTRDSPETFPACALIHRPPRGWVTSSPAACFGEQHKEEICMY